MRRKTEECNTKEAENLVSVEHSWWKSILKTVNALTLKKASIMFSFSCVFNVHTVDEYVWAHHHYSLFFCIFGNIHTKFMICMCVCILKWKMGNNVYLMVYCCCYFCFDASTHRCNWKPPSILLVSLLLLPVFVMKKKLILAQTFSKTFIDLYLYSNTRCCCALFFLIRLVAAAPNPFP